jgi:SAM-dependent methyltransferase
VKDRFSSHAPQYAAFRPIYPASLYEFILRHVNGYDAAWDCACGNGQVARDLAPHFSSVFATDISQKQLDNAYHASNIRYSIAPAGKTPFPDKSFDLITVAQAMHWFGIPDFFKEAKRVGKDGSILAYWGYGLFRVGPDVDLIIDDFYVRVIGPYWDPERKMIDDSYSTITPPFEIIETPEFDFSFNWTLAELEGYITTWSSVQKYITDRGTNPMNELMRQVQPFWPHGKSCRVTFPLFLTVCRL